MAVHSNSKFEDDCQCYIKYKGVDRPWNEFRQELSSRAVAEGVDDNKLTISHPLFRQLLDDWGGRPASART